MAADTVHIRVIDLTGPHPTSAKGNRYILTVIDHFSKWVEIFPMRNQKASTVTRLLVDRVICVHGCPKQILTDQGPNFDSQLFQELCRLLAIDKIRTSPYRPSTNGNIERFHFTMHSLIAKWVSANHRDWDEKLPAVAFAYRSTVHESTGFTPYFLMHGREARVPADLVYGEPEISPYNSDTDFPSHLTNTLHKAFATARQNLNQAAKRRQDRYDLRSRPTIFPVGSWVWCLVPRRVSGRYQKWRSLYQGPFEVLRQLGAVTYEIQRNKRTRTWIVHVDKLKPCHNPDDPTPDSHSFVDTSVESNDDHHIPRLQREIRKPVRFR